MHLFWTNCNKETAKYLSKSPEKLTSPACIIHSCQLYLKKKKMCVKNTEFCINTTWLLDVHYPFSNKRPLGTKWGFFCGTLIFLTNFEEFCFAYVPYNILYVICLQILYGLCYFQHIWGLKCDQHPSLICMQFFPLNS